MKKMPFCYMLLNLTVETWAMETVTWVACTVVLEVGLMDCNLPRNVTEQGLRRRLD